MAKSGDGARLVEVIASEGDGTWEVLLKVSGNFDNLEIGCGPTRESALAQATETLTTAIEKVRAAK
jgi:hypothetical protein